MTEKVYVDANVFVYAATNTDKIGKNSYNLLEKIRKGEVDGITSVLTFDEVMWTIQKIGGKTKAHDVVSAMLIIPNLTSVDVTKNIFAEALCIYKEGLLGPRDSIHLATMRFKNTEVIITHDSDFNRLKGIKARKPEESP